MAPTSSSLITVLLPLLNGAWLSIVSYETSGTCIINHITYTMRQSYKLRSPMSKETAQHHFRCYVVYTLGTTLLVLFLIICFDVATGNYKDVLQLNGQCKSADIHGHSTIIVPLIFAAINKIIQLVQLIPYLYYTYKLKQDISDAGTHSNQLSLLHKIAAVLGVTIGLLFFLYVAQAIFNFDYNLMATVESGLSVIQQCIIVALLLFTKKVYRLCRGCLLTD